MKAIRRFLLVAIAAAIALPLAAQAPTPSDKGKSPGLFQGPKREKGEDENVRSVAGVVRNENDEVVEGAVVKLKDTKSLRVRSYITQKDGVYRFHGLSTNIDYALKADYKDQSSEERTLSVFDSRRQAVINLKLESPKEKAQK
jgi:hypothetical protein